MIAEIAQIQIDPARATDFEAAVAQIATSSVRIFDRQALP
jgi:hypothetical protein